MPSLLTEIRGQIAYLTLNRPQALNAFDPEIIVSLAKAWETVDADDNVRAVIVTGAGERAFSAGADLMRLIPLLGGVRKPEDQWDRELLKLRGAVDRAVLKDNRFYKPVIAAVNGLAIGGALELVMATDVRVAVDSATFALQEPRWGLIPGGGGVTRLPRQIPQAKAMEMLLTAKPIDAHEAHRLGLVNYVVPREQLMAKAEELAAAIAENGPLALRAIKEAVVRSAGQPLYEAFRIEARMTRRVRKTEDAKEGPRAFAEKRKPVFKGR